MSRRPAVSTARLALRQVVTDRVAVATVAVIVVACAALASALPRALDAMLTDGLRQAIADASPNERDLAARMTAAPPSAPGEDPLGPTRRLLDDIRADLPPLVRERTGDPLYSASYTDLGGTSVAPRLQPPKGVMDWDVTTLSRLADHVEYTEGRGPQAITTTAVPGAQVGELHDPVAAERSVVEVAVSVRTASDTGVTVGSTVDLPGNLDLVVVGVFEPRDAEDVYWGWSGAALRPPVIVDPGRGDIYQPVALVDATTWPGIERQIGQTRRSSLLLRIPVSDNGLRAADAAELLAQVRQVESTPFELPGASVNETPFTPTLGGFRMVSNLDVVLVGHLHARAASTALVSVVATGMLAVALAVLALAARLVVERRRRGLALAVARGASPRQVVGLMAVEGLLIGVPAAVLGTALAATAVRGEPGAPGLVLPAVLGIAPAVLLPVLARPGGLRAVRRDITKVRGRRLRLAAEGLVVALAVGALLLLRRRGLDSSRFEVVGGVVRLGDHRLPRTGVDPLLAAAPVLLALALALLLARLYPRPVEVLASASARRRGAVPFLGAARAGRDATAGTLPLVVLLLALATSVFGTVVAGTSTRGAEVAAWQTLGAPARTSALAFGDEALEAASDVDGVDQAAGVTTTAGVATTDRRSVDVTLAGVDAASLEAVQRTVPGAVPLGGLTAQGIDEGDVVPVVVTGGLAEVGEKISLQAEQATTRLVVVGSVERFPGLGSARPLVVADRATLLAAGGGLPAADTVLLSLSPGADARAVERGVQEALGTGAPLVTHADAVERVRSQPLVAGTLRAFPLTSVVGAALSGLAVVLTLVVGAPERSRLLSRLRTLGLSQQQARWLVVWEVAPLVLTALVAGAVAGLAVPWLLLPAIDLRAFTGGPEQPAYTVDAGAVLTILAGFALVTAVSLALAVAANRRLRLGSVLRVGDES